MNLTPIVDDLKDRMHRVNIPGAALAIIADGEIVLADGFGVTSVEDAGLPMTPDTVARAASISKSLTATAVMRLVEQGRMELDRPVIEYLGSLRLSVPGAAERVTLRMLLSHTGGLYRDVDWWGSRDFDALEVYVRDVLPTVPMAAPPGVLWSYSNSGIGLAARVAEVVTDDRYPDLMDELLFEPLGMTRTTFDLSVAATYPLSQSHRMDPDGNLSVDHRQPDAVAFSPSGGALTTVNDLARYLVMHMSDGLFEGRHVLQESTVAEMHRSAVSRYTPAGDGYGLGFYTGWHRGRHKVWHWGRTLRNGGLAITIPEEKVGLALLYNRQADRFGGDDFAAMAMDVLLGESGPSKAPSPAQAADVDWARWTGRYVGPNVGLVEIESGEDGTRMIWNGVALKLARHGADVLVGRTEDGFDVAVGAVGGPGGAGKFLQINGTPSQRWDGEVQQIEPADLAPYVGHYGLFDRILLTVEGGRLMLDSETHGRKLECLAIGKRKFACAIGTVEFPDTDYAKAPWLKFAEFARFERRG